MPCAQFALLMTAVSGITCFPHTPVLHQNVLEIRGEICAKNHVGLVDYTENDVKGFSDISHVLTLSAYAYQEALPLVQASLVTISTSSCSSLFSSLMKPGRCSMAELPDTVSETQAGAETGHRGESSVPAELAGDIARRTLLKSLTDQPVPDADGRALELLVSQQHLIKTAPTPASGSPPIARRRTLGCAL
jgi:hypothetical protein